MPRTGFQCKLFTAPNATTPPAFPTSGAITPWVQIAGVVSFTLPDEEVGEIDVTELDQLDGTDPDTVMRTDPQPFENPGEIPFECHLSSAGFAELRGYKGKKRFYRVSLPDPDGTGGEAPIVGVGRAFLKKVGGGEASKTDALKVKGTIKISEKWTWS